MNLKKIYFLLKINISSLKTKFYELSFDSKLILCGTILFILSFLATEYKKNNIKPSGDTAKTHEQNLNEMIPKGYMIYPIDVINASSLHAMMGSFAYVNLYAPRKRQKGTKLIGKNLKIIRSPKDPEQFALVIKESDYINQLEPQNKYYVTIKNPKLNEKENLIRDENHSDRRISISYQN